MGKRCTFLKRRQRIRNSLRVRGNEKLFRIVVFRSNKHIYAQLICDNLGFTLVSASTMEKDIIKVLTTESQKVRGNNVVAARAVGKVLAERAKQVGFTESIVFDRGGYSYHGRIKALAEAAREHGMLF